MHFYAGYMRQILADFLHSYALIPVVQSRPKSRSSIQVGKQKASELLHLALFMAGTGLLLLLNLQSSYTFKLPASPLDPDIYLLEEPRGRNCL